jgi:phage FluMu protein gp41
MGLPADRQLAIRLKELRRDDQAPADRLASGSAKAERRSLTSEEAKILEQAWERAVQTGQSQSVWITVALNQYDLLKKELTDLGNIEAESSTPERSDAAAESSGWLRVKVMLLLPLSSEKPASSQPASR